eukprot:scaffold72769_cov17-Tisochrysis_lutea.AAC.1
MGLGHLDAHIELRLQHGLKAAQSAGSVFILTENRLQQGFCFPERALLRQNLHQKTTSANSCRLDMSDQASELQCWRSGQP